MRLVRFGVTSALIPTLCLAPATLLAQTTLDVGPGRAFERIEPALAKAQPGDTILVHPRPNNEPYTAVALRISRPRITLRAATASTARIVLSGQGADLSGIGSQPRAIVQFEPDAHGSRLLGFELTAAHNASHNGAGARINQTNDIHILDCVIHHNDMGIMSNGDGTPRTANRQRIENCRIFSNGDSADPGFNHNLYLGGTSATLLGCEIHSSLTGHNIKSRAHRTEILACSIHSSANREIDLVDALGDTTTPDSSALIAGCVIRKDPACAGNRGVIHFGQDGGHAHDGTLALVHNTILTPFVSPVVQLSTPDARLALFNNVIMSPSAQTRNQVLYAGVDPPGQPPAPRIQAAANALGPGFDRQALAPLGLQPLTIPAESLRLLLAPPDRSSLRPDQPGPPELVDQGMPLEAIPPAIFTPPLFEYDAQTSGAVQTRARTIIARPDLGAFEFPTRIPAP